MVKNIGRFVKTITLATIIAGLLASTVACSSAALKDMSSEGYDWGFFQVAQGTKHDRTLTFFVDKRGPFGGLNHNVIEGSYFNTGTEAPEHLRDPAGRMIFAQNEDRRYFNIIDNTRNDVSRITLFDPSTGTLNGAFMSRYKTEWWGDADYRTISVNNGPVMIRLAGVTDHLGIKTQEVMAVAIPREGQDYSWLLNPKNEEKTNKRDLEKIADELSRRLKGNDFTWMFNQDYAVGAKNALTGVAKKLEKTDFRPNDMDILITTRDNDKFIDFMGVELAPAQGELYNGQVKYIISTTYAGPNNKLAGGGFLSKGFWGHEGAPDKHNKLGKSLDTLTISLGSLDQKPDYWEPKAQIIVNHPNWSNQTEYEFYRINSDGRKELKGVLQRTYNNRSTYDSDGKLIEPKGTNNYLAKGDLQFIADILVLMGGQQIPLGFDYKTSYMDYSLDLVVIADGITPGGAIENLNPELVAALNVNANATIGNVIRAGKSVLGVEPPERFQKLLEKQLEANAKYHSAVRNNPGITEVYGVSK